MDKIYNLNLHESMETKRFFITRVAGGWLYENANGQIVFVPFDNEYQQYQ